MKKRWRVTQYEQLSELGKILKVGHKDYRWYWMAKISAWINKGESAGFGLCTLTTEIADLQA